MLIPNFSQFSTHLSMFGDRVINKVYLRIDGLDHVCIDMDTDGKVIGNSVYIPSIKMFCEIST